MTLAKTPDVGKLPRLPRLKPECENDIVDHITLILAMNGLRFTLSNDLRLIGVNIADADLNAYTCDLEGIGQLITSSLKWEQVRQWVLGDLCNLGFRLGGEAFAQRLPADKTLINWSSICSKYPHADRCFDLPFSHYAEVAYVEDKRARTNLLAQAQEKNWSVQELRAARNLDAGNPTPAIDYEFTVYSGVSTAIKLWNSGAIDKAQYEELIAKYGRGELSVEIKVLGRR